MKLSFVCNPTVNMVRPSYLGRALARRGYEVSVIVPPGTRVPELFGLDAFPEVTLHRLPPGGSARAAVAAALAALAPEVVHCVAAGKATLPGSLAYARRSGALCLVDMPDWMPGWPRLRSKLTVVFERQALARADAVVVASQDLLERYQGRRHHARLYYLPFGVDVDFFEAHRDQTPPGLVRVPGVKLITYLGALVPQYAPQEALAMARVLATRRRDFRLLFLGQGPQRETLEAQAAAWGLGDLVTFAGFVPETELPGYLAASDALLCPLADNAANRYRCPSKAFWYLAARRPIIANPVGEAGRALGDEALYYEFGNAESCADQVEVALSGEAPIPSAERVAGHSWTAITDRYEAILADLRGGGGGG